MSKIFSSSRTISTASSPLDRFVRWLVALRPVHADEPEDRAGNRAGPRAEAADGARQVRNAGHPTQCQGGSSRAAG